MYGKQVPNFDSGGSEELARPPASAVVFQFAMLILIVLLLNIEVAMHLIKVFTEQHGWFPFPVHSGTYNSMSMVYTRGSTTCVTKC